MGFVLFLGQTDRGAIGDGFVHMAVHSPTNNFNICKSFETMYFYSPTLVEHLRTVQSVGLLPGLENQKSR